jgi:hypothetical protein
MALAGMAHFYGCIDISGISGIGLHSKVWPALSCTYEVVPSSF